MRRALRRLTLHLPRPRIIWNRGGTVRYLSRFYLFGSPRMPDGSQPFDSHGNPREGVEWPAGGTGVYIHRFHRGDDDLALHNHPWKWAVSIVLAGGYREELRTADDRVVTRVVRPGDVNVIRHETFHRVDLIENDAWTLFIAGPKVASWGFWDRNTRIFWPWREFLRHQGVRDARA